MIVTAKKSSNRSCSCVKIATVGNVQLTVSLDAGRNKMKIDKTHCLVFILAILLAGCSTGTVTPGMTLFTGLTGYHDEMEGLETQAARWPERQRLGDSIRTTYLVTMGGSREFNRLVELDVKRREYLIALRGTSLRSERATEIKQELIKINEDIDGLSALVKGQLARTSPGPEPQQVIESVATIGLLHLAIDAFSSASVSNGASAPTAKMAGYTVTDQRKFAIVRTPEGKTFQCTTIVVKEEGAGIRCGAVAGK